MLTPRDSLYYDNWQDFVHFRFLRMLLKKVPLQTFDDIDDDVNESLTHTAVADDKTGAKVYQTQLAYTPGDYPRERNDLQTEMIRPFISDQLDYYTNKFIQPQIDELKQRCSNLENHCSSLESSLNNALSRINSLENNH